MDIPTAPPGVLCHLGVFDNVLLDNSSMPHVCLGGRHPLSCSSLGQTAAFPSLPEVLMWAGIWAGVRHRAAYQHVLPPVCKHTGPSFHPSPPSCLQEGLRKQGLSRGCRGAHPPVLRDHLSLHLTLCGRQQGGVTLLCQRGTPLESSSCWESREQAIVWSPLIE